MQKIARWSIALIGLFMIAIPAQAALSSFSSNPATLNGVSLGGIPAWYQDQNGVSLEPCLIPLDTNGAAVTGLTPALSAAIN